jgi:hypothetical protein
MRQTSGGFTVTYHGISIQGSLASDSVVMFRFHLHKVYRVETNGISLIFQSRGHVCLVFAGRFYRLEGSETTV